MLPPFRAEGYGNTIPVEIHRALADHARAQKTPDEGTFGHRFSSSIEKGKVYAR
jgi:hypothetical protein